MNIKSFAPSNATTMNDNSAASESVNGVYTQQHQPSGRKCTKSSSQFTPKQSRLVNLVQSDSSEEDVEARSLLVDEESIMLLREMPIRQLRDIVLMRSKHDIMKWEVFSAFTDQIFPREYESMDRQASANRMYYPVETLFLLHFLPLVPISVNVPFAICEYLKEMMKAENYENNQPYDTDRWSVARKELATMMNRLPVYRYVTTSNSWTICAERTLTELWIISLQYLRTVLDATPLESMPTSSAIDMWTLTESAYRRYVSRTALKRLHEYFTSSRWDWLVRLS